MRNIYVILVIVGKGKKTTEQHAPFDPTVDICGLNLPKPSSPSGSLPSLILGGPDVTVKHNARPCPCLVKGAST